MRSLTLLLLVTFAQQQTDHNEPKGRGARGEKEGAEQWQPHLLAELAGGEDCQRGEDEERPDVRANHDRKR